jgi:hypothetical protein
MAITIISCPSGLCLAGNLPKLTFTADADVRIRLLDGNKTLLDETYTPDFSNTISLDLSEVVHNALTFTLPAAGLFVQPELVRTFTLLLDNSTYNFTAIRTGVKRLNVEPSVFLAKNFLTWQPQTKEVIAVQPEWLTYYASQTCHLYVRAEVYNNNIRSKKIADFAAGNAYTVNTSVERITALVGYPPARYDIYVVATDSPSGPRLSNIQQYIVVGPTPNEQFFCFQNSLGGIDTVRCTGEAKHTPEYTPSTALFNEVEDTYHIEKKDLKAQNTGWLRKDTAAWLNDFFASKQRYKYEDGALQPVVIDEVTAETSTAEDLIAFEFTYRESTASTYLNLKRDFGSTTATWTTFMNILEQVDNEFTATWSDYVNVLKKTCRNAYSHAYSRAYNCTSPETP